MGERDFIALVDGVHSLVKVPVVLVWDRLTSMSQAAYSPDPNPVEWVWAHVKRNLAHLALVALDRPEVLVCDGSNAFSTDRAPSTGFIAGPGVTLDEPASP